VGKSSDKIVKKRVRGGCEEEKAVVLDHSFTAI